MNSFMKMIHSGVAEIEVKSNLKITEDFAEEESCDVLYWGGEKIASLLVQWGRRIVLLDQVTRLVRAYKQ